MMTSTDAPKDAPRTPTSSARVVPISSGVPMIDDRMEKGETQASVGVTKEAPSTTTKKRRLLYITSLLVVATIVGTVAGVLTAKNGRSLTPDDNETESSTVQSSPSGVDTGTEQDPTFCCGDDIDKERPYYCRYPIGDCGANPEEAECKQIPTICTAQYDPVCGCDSQTYSNACGAAGRGISIRSMGKCPDDPDETDLCADDDECQEENSFCMFATGSCGPSGPGKCVVKEATCEEDLKPVCGCDGATYSNICEARSMGVSVESHGECSDVKDDSQMCECGGDACILVFPTGDCGASDEGECQERPTFCGRIDDPVCGCDKNTYVNECEARKEGGTSVLSFGECP